MFGHREGRVSGRTGRQTCVTVGRSSGRVVGYWSRGKEGRSGGWEVNRTDSRGGRTHGPTANGRTYRRWKREAVRRTVLATDGRAVPRSTVGRADSRKDGRKNGRADGRSHGLGRDQSQGSGADRTPDRVMGKSTERQEQTPTDVLCAWMQRSAAPAGQFRDGSQPCPTRWRALQTSSRLSQRLSKGLGSIIPASATVKDGESAEKQRR